MRDDIHAGYCHTGHITWALTLPKTDARFRDIHGDPMSCPTGTDQMKAEQITDQPQQRDGSRFDPDGVNHVPLRIEVRAKAWASLMTAIPSAFTAFTRIPELVAIDISCVADPDADLGHCLSNVPNAWMAIGGMVGPFIPDVTGPGDLARDLWSIGNEVMPAIMGGDLHGCLDHRFPRQSLIFTRDFAIRRDTTRLDRFSSEWDECTMPADRLLHGFCGQPETAHGVLALHRRIRATVQHYTEILGCETGIDVAPGRVDIVPEAAKTV